MRVRANILVVEDEPLLLMLYEDAVIEEGHVALTADNLSDGLKLAQTPIDVAILDIRLGEERVFPLAHLLLERGIPFLFCSGTVGDMPNDEFSHTLILRKPIGAHEVVMNAIGLLPTDSACAEA